LLILAGCAATPRAPRVAGVEQQAPTSLPATELTGRARLVQDARALAPMVHSAWVRRFLAATRRLPHIAARRLYHTADAKRYYTEAQARRLSPEARSALKVLEVDEEYYYSTRYGSPLAYSRALDLAAEQGLEGITGRRVLDFGHGKIGHLRLMAECGAHVVGVDVDPSLPLVYGRPGDQGKIGTSGGQLRLVNGRFPVDAEVTRAVGTGYDLVTSKNTLKMGYIHPARPVVPPRRAIDLGVPDARFVQALFALLRPGGYLVIYNLYPKQAAPDQPYKPWADGKTPFARRLFEEAGFEVLVFDRDDTPFIRRLGQTLGWDRGPEAMDLENDLFAVHTVARRP
jgi:SAM-dependent methyltransferase